MKTVEQIEKEVVALLKERATLISGEGERFLIWDNNYLSFHNDFYLLDPKKNEDHALILKSIDNIKNPVQKKLFEDWIDNFDETICKAGTLRECGSCRCCAVCENIESCAMRDRTPCCFLAKDGLTREECDPSEW